MTNLFYKFKRPSWVDESAAGAAKLSDDFLTGTDKGTPTFCNEQPFRRVIWSNWRNEFLETYREDVFLADELNPPYEDVESIGPDEPSQIDDNLDLLGLISKHSPNYKDVKLLRKHLKALIKLADSVEPNELREKTNIQKS